MKKNILLIAALALLTLGFTSCEKKSAGLTSITYYADIQLEGDSYMVVAKGSTFVDPGFSATMAGKDVTDQVEVVSDVDTSASGIYTITYSIVNADGFPSSATRTVVVLDITDPIEGIWKVDQASSFRIYDGGAPGAYKGAFEFLILADPRGFYYVEDLMAGWYAQGAGYGSNYAMMAYVAVAPDFSLQLLASAVPGWGDEADDLQDGVWDPTTNTISYVLFYAGVIEFHVTINKVDLGL